jgi:hypothetical protein
MSKSNIGPPIYWVGFVMRLFQRLICGRRSVNARGGLARRDTMMAQK